MSTQIKKIKNAVNILQKYSINNARFLCATKLKHMYSIKLKENFKIFNI